MLQSYRMRSYSWVLALAVLSVARTTAAEGRQGWYLDFHGGVVTQTNVGTVETREMEIVSEHDAVGTLELDIGHTFRPGISLSLGVMAENWVQPNVTIDVKYSFSRHQRLQPYLYLCLLGSAIHWFPLGAYIGAGADYFVTDRVFMAVDMRVGYKARRITKDTSHWLEQSVTLGFGVVFSGRGYGADRPQSPSHL
jgi:hypothetical protein